MKVGDLVRRKIFDGKENSGKEIGLIIELANIGMGVEDVVPRAKILWQEYERIDSYWFITDLEVINEDR